MNVTLEGSNITAEFRAAIQDTIARAIAGIRDQEKMNAAAERMDRMREQNRLLGGAGDIGVEIVRSMRQSR